MITVREIQNVLLLTSPEEDEDKMYKRALSIAKRAEARKVRNQYIVDDTEKLAKVLALEGKAMVNFLTRAKTLAALIEQAEMYYIKHYS